MQQQVENLGYEFNMTEKSYIRELLENGKVTIAKGEKMLAEAGEDKDNIKKANGKIAEGKDGVEYARELNTFRNKYANT